MRLCGRHSSAAMDVLRKGSFRKQCSIDGLRDRLRPRSFYKRTNTIKATVSEVRLAGDFHSDILTQIDEEYNLSL
jgi:hypothetical protein